MLIATSFSLLIIHSVLCEVSFVASIAEQVIYLVKQWGWSKCDVFIVTLFQYSLTVIFMVKVWMIEKLIKVGSENGQSMKPVSKTLWLLCSIALSSVINWLCNYNEGGQSKFFSAWPHWRTSYIDHTSSLPTLINLSNNFCLFLGF